MPALFLYCRAGFEAECAAEIQSLAQHHDVSGYCQTTSQSGYVLFHTTDLASLQSLHANLPFAEVIFARQWFIALAQLKDMPVTDRITPLLAALHALPCAANEVFFETPDTNAGKELAALCRSIATPFTKQATANGILKATQLSPYRLHLCFLPGAQAFAGYALINNSAPWPMGIPRLKASRDAPSRSALKLEEAWLRFLTPQEQALSLQPGMRAVDLGAAPGGWTSELVKRHIHVIAVDNGNIDPKLLESGLVEHVRGDGFRYRPKKTVDWMVCDIVEQPIRIAELAALWLSGDLCRFCIFNLKLPMKKRYHEVQRCIDRVRESLVQSGLECQIRAKQLYHDREEVTVYVSTRSHA